jgi:3D (Asp-Asp-Asp) domain-containing protein
LKRSKLFRFGTSVALAGTLLGSPLLPHPSAAASQERLPDPIPDAHVWGTEGEGLVVRDGPGADFAALLRLPEGARVRVVGGPRVDREGRAWLQIVGPDQTTGWCASEFIARYSGPARGVVVQASRPAPASSSQRIIPARVTAYSYQVPGNGAHGTITRSGTQARWGTVAVDPRVIPLGSRLRIEGYDDVFIAEDTGGAVVGDRIEIFFTDEAAAIQFGVRNLQVTVLDDAPARFDAPVPGRP